MKKLFLFTLLAMLAVCFAKGQTTVGSDLVPEKGALLQLKQWNPEHPTTDNSNSKKGLGLPRVALKNLNSLEPLLDPSASDYESQKILHQGLMVYNMTHDEAKGLEPGVFVWRGDSFWFKQDVIGDDFLLTVRPESNYLEFPSGMSGIPIQAQNVEVEWRPVGVSADLELFHTLNGGVKWNLTSAQSNTGISGEYTLSIKPDDFTQTEIDENPFLCKKSILSVKSYDMSGSELSKELELVQIHYSLIVKGFKPYMELGREYKINIATNTQWQLTIEDPDGLIDASKTNLPTTGTVNEEGLEYTFCLADDDSKEGKTLSLSFTSVIDGHFVKQDYKINSIRKFDNCYMLTPGASIEIPIRRAYAVWANDLETVIPANKPVGAKLLWQDEQSLIKKTIQLVGGDKGIASIIRVETNAGKEGNAVVAVEIDGVIRWSWHLWVTAYDPSTNVLNYPAEVVGNVAVDSTDVAGGKVYARFNKAFTTVLMDRALGALSIDPTDPKLQGYFYQYGRKDPFAPSQIMVGNSWAEKPIYDINNVQLVKSTTGFKCEDVPSTPVVNLANTVIRPMTFYNPCDENNNDWYSRKYGVANSTLWLEEDGSKGVYDPCPAGWRLMEGGPGTKSVLYGIPVVPFSKPRIIDMRKHGLGFIVAQGLGNPDGVDPFFIANRGQGYFHVAGHDSEFLSSIFDVANTMTNTWRMMQRGQLKNVRCQKEK